MSIALRLREPADDELHFQMQADPLQVATTVPARSRADFDEWIARISADPLVVLRTITLDGEMVGTINTFMMEGKTWIGYRIANQHWRKGIATEAVRLMVAEDRRRPLHAKVLASNVGSVRALERSGFVKLRDQISSDGPEWILRLP